MRKKVAHHSARWVLILTFISILFIAFFTGFARVSLPFVGSYRGEIQNYVSTVLGKTVEIGELDLSWQKFGPRLILHDVALDSGADTAQNIALKKIYFDLDLLRSWVNGAWQINEVSIVGAKLTLDYYGNQNFQVYGENIDGKAPAADSSEGIDVLSWLLHADRVGLLDSSVTIRHRKKDFSVEVQDLNIRAGNQDGVHQVRVDLLIPSLSDEQIALNVDFSGDRKKLNDSDGAFHISMQDVDLGKTTELLKDFTPLSVVGVSDLNIWGGWSKGEVSSLRIQSELDQTIFTNKSTLANFTSPASFSDWVVVKENDSYKLALNSLKVNDIDTNFKLLMRFNPLEQKSWWLDLAGQELELSEITPLVEVVLGDSESLKSQMIASIRGQLADWRLQLKGHGYQFPLLSADVRFADLSIGDTAELTGVQGIAGRLSMRDNSGVIELINDEFLVNLPKWFNRPTSFSQLDGSIGFRIDKDRIVVQSDDLLVTSEGVSASGRVKLQKNAGFDPYVDVTGSALRVTVAEARQFFPEKIMQPNLLNWLDDSIKEGSLTDINVVVKGTAKGFPYANNEGVFSADFKFKDGKVLALKDWPSVDIHSAGVKFRQSSLQVDVEKGKTFGNALSNAALSIADLKHPVIKLSGSSQSTMGQALAYIRNSPLDQALEPLVKSASASGPISLDIDLTAPISQGAEGLSYQGRVAFGGNDWLSDELGLAFESIKGDLQFSQDSLTSKGLTALAFNAPVTITAKTDKANPSLFSRIDVVGNIATNAVLENYKLPISQWFVGTSPWDLTLELKRGSDAEAAMTMSLLAKSDLVGTSVDLPRPYGKQAKDKGQLSANISLDGKTEGQRWNFSYANNLRARVATKPNGEGLDALLVRFNEALPAISTAIDGVSIEGRVSELAFDSWVSTIADVIANLEESSERTPIMPIRGKLLADDMLVGTVSSGPASFSFDTDSEHISTKINSTWLSGDLQYPREYWLEGKPLKSRLALLDKQFLDSLATGEGGDESRIDPRDFPPIELVVDRFVWDEYHVADLNMRSKPVSDGMKTEALGFVHKDLQMSGEAYWRLLDPQNIVANSKPRHRTDITASLKSDDVGAGLTGIGIVGAFSGGQGQLDVNVAWDDAAYAPDLSMITGSIKPELKSGRILAVEPGAAKVLGLFALQAIPRRLSLDFNDVTQDGLQYDEISGDIGLADGIATTNYMQLNGPIGVVSSSGLTDFVNSTYDQNVVVLPRLTSALPIIGLISAGATAGVGVLVADQLLKGVGVNFDEVGKREYRLTGSWDDPQITRLHVPLKHLPEPENR